MALLDFKDIPLANSGSGMQDTFELLARETFLAMGFEIVVDPSRGADGGRDLIVAETRVGLLRNTKVRWLVSCKHFAHSGRSVTPDDEINVTERVRVARCDGFLGFYSTLPSTGLKNLLDELPNLEVKLFDREEIERIVLKLPDGSELIKRFFPETYRLQLAATPATLYSGAESQRCDYCGKELLVPATGVWVLWRDDRDDSLPNHYVDMHFSCRGLCDRMMKVVMQQKHKDRGQIYDGWGEIREMMIPTLFITKLMAFINGLAGGETYEAETFDRFKQLLLKTFPYVSRHLSQEDRQRITSLQMIPSYLGGLGYEE